MPEIDSWTVAPCGCGFGLVGDTYVHEPCRVDCELFLWALEQIEQLGIPHETWDLS